MGVPTSEVGYTSATARRGDHESSYEHVVALEKKNMMYWAGCSRSGDVKHGTGCYFIKIQVSAVCVAEEIVGSQEF